MIPEAVPPVVAQTHPKLNQDSLFRNQTRFSPIRGRGGCLFPPPLPRIHDRSHALIPRCAMRKHWRALNHLTINSPFDAGPTISK